METAKIGGHSAHILKIELNSSGDYIVVSADDPNLFDRYAAGYKRIVDLANSIPRELEEIEKKYRDDNDFSATMDKSLEMSGVNVNFSKESVRTIDGIFGEETIRKYFRETYEEIPDFLPDADCIMDFFEEITPVMEGLFDRKMERQRESSKARMERYKPQDFKKKKGKSK